MPAITYGSSGSVLVKGMGGVQRGKCDLQNTCYPLEELRASLQSCLSKADFTPFTYSPLYSTHTIRTASG
jgi:hypothetical protein